MSTESKITAREMGDMIEHWLKTPVGAYLGSDYGSDKLSLLQIPLTDTTAADEFVRKLCSIHTYLEPFLQLSVQIGTYVQTLEVRTMLSVREWQK